MAYQTVVEEIRQNLELIMTRDEATMAQVNQWDGDWYYVKANEAEVILGRTREEAIATIAKFAELQTPTGSLYPLAWGVVSEDEQEQRVRY